MQRKGGRRSHIGKEAGRIMLCLDIFFDVVALPFPLIQVEVKEDGIMRILNPHVALPLVDDDLQSLQSGVLVLDDDHPIIEKVNTPKLLVGVVVEIVVAECFDTSTARG